MKATVVATHQKESSLKGDMRQQLRKLQSKIASKGCGREVSIVPNSLIISKSMLPATVPACKRNLIMKCSMLTTHLAHAAYHQANVLILSPPLFAASREAGTIFVSSCR